MTGGSVLTTYSDMRYDPLRDGSVLRRHVYFGDAERRPFSWEVSVEKKSGIEILASGEGADRRSAVEAADDVYDAFYFQN